MKQAPLIKLIILICLLISFPALAAPVGESAGEIWIDGPDDLKPGMNPAHPDAAVDHLGRSIFVWDGNPAVNGGNDIFLRIFPAGGGPPQDPVLVNTLLQYNQTYPRVAVSSDGSFLVVWESYEPHEPGDNERRKIRSQAFNANAQPVGTEQLLSTLTTGEVTPVSVDVAALRDGDYVVAWHSSNSFQDDTNLSIQARRVGVDGAPLAEQFQVNTIEGGAQQDPSVTGLSDGGYLVVWVEPDVQGRRYGADDIAEGESFQINTETQGGEDETEAVLHEDGRVLVIWRDDEDPLNSWEIRGRLYSPNLLAQGSDFRINSLLEDGQLKAKVAPYGQGGFFVVWENNANVGGDNAPSSIIGRIVTGRDQFAGPQFLVNSWTQDSQQFPGIGGNNGRIAVAWDSQSGPESSTSVILGQFWNICGIFCDGFE